MNFNKNAVFNSEMIVKLTLIKRFLFSFSFYIIFLSSIIIGKEKSYLQGKTMHYKGNQKNENHFTGHHSPFKEKSGQNWTTEACPILGTETMVMITTFYFICWKP